MPTCFDRRSVHEHGTSDVGSAYEGSKCCLIFPHPHSYFLVRYPLLSFETGVPTFHSNRQYTALKLATDPFLPAFQSKHVALIGDHKQLPPVITSPEAQAKGLSVSLFERLSEENCKSRWSTAIGMKLTYLHVRCSRPLSDAGHPVPHAPHHLSFPIARVLR